MRLSVKKDDPGFDADTQHCQIFVDGLDVTARCYTADEEEGKAWCFKHNELGEVFCDPATDKPAAEVLSGKVVIVLGAEINGYDPHSSN